MRLIGVQFKINERDFNGGFPEHIEKFYRGTNPGDFIIFPEDIGLLTAFSSIDASSSVEALQTIYSKNQETIDAIAIENEIENFTTAVFLSLTDVFVRDFYELFSSLSRKYSVYTLACNNMPAFSKEGDVWKFTDPKVYNSAFVFGKMGELIFKQNKVNLTQMEKDLGISGDRMSQVSTFTIEGRRFGIAISLDAFVPQYISRLEDAEVIIQPDANPGKWNSVLSNGRWQPEEWMDSAYYITQRIEKVMHVINPMMVGKLFDVIFEGQSSITKKADAKDPKMGYIGNLPTTGFHSVLGIPGYDSNHYIPRETVLDKQLEYNEGVIEIEL
jgi:predicted amidohydrolase